MSNSASLAKGDPAGQQPLPDEVRDLLAPYFPGLDLDRIVLNLTGIPWYVPKKMDAFTNRHHIYFARGRFHPGTASGVALIAHELTHCDQFKRHGTWIFRVKYGWSWLVELLRNMSFNEAYYQNRYEVEARAMQNKVYLEIWDRLP
jgi:Domain of unknown function (DUF4157)